MTMNHTMENELVKVTIKGLGAELSSFVLKEDGTEYIWQADPLVWGRHAPILFPIVGKLKDNTYRIKDQNYSLSQHGFARDLEFELILASANRCTYRLLSSPQTLVNYPFLFELTVSYHLDGASLGIDYAVRNTGQDVMYFSIGAHPGFNWPLKPTEETAEDYVIQFSETEELYRIRIEDGLISNYQTPFLKNEASFPLTADLFKDDALVFHNVRSNTVMLRSKRTDKFVQMDITGFPYLGIWSKAGEAPFVCLEPWFGLADGVDSNYDFTQKAAIQKLEPNHEFTCTYAITIG